MKVIYKYLKIRIYPTKVGKNDDGLDVVSKTKIKENLGISRFVWNKELHFINNFRLLLLQNGYSDRLTVNRESCNIILNILKEENPFLDKSDITTLELSQKDLINAFKKYYDSNLNSDYPIFKSKKRVKQSFKILNIGNNICIEKDKNGYDKLKLAKLGLVKFRTSKEYKKQLRQASDENDKSIEIMEVTVTEDCDKYYAAVKVRCKII